jgi:hypothetical protein
MLWILKRLLPIFVVTGAVAGAGGSVAGATTPVTTTAPVTTTTRVTTNPVQASAGLSLAGTFVVQRQYVTVPGRSVHGYDSAPDYPASHGCMRLPIPDVITAYNWPAYGDAVDVYY